MIRCFVFALAVVMISSIASAAVLFEDGFDGTPGQDIASYDSDYSVSTSGASPAAGYPVNEINAAGDGVALGMGVDGGNPGAATVGATNDADFTDTSMPAYVPGVQGFFFASAQVNFASLSFQEEENEIAISTTVSSINRTISFGVRSTDDAGNFEAFAQNNSPSVGAPISAADADADGNIRLVIKWQNQTGSFTNDNNVLFGINPASEADLVFSTGPVGNDNGSTVANAAISAVELRATTGNFVGGPTRADGTFDSVQFATTFNEVIPEPTTASLCLLGAVALLGRRRRQA